MSTHRSAQDIVTAVVQRVDRFTAGAEQNDDLSVVVLKVL
jgi:serine phosphatase RsbU (regulator of sigma subunit)